MKASIPPDLVLLICGALMWLIADFLPQYTFRLPHKGLWFGLVLLAGFSLSLSAKIAMSRHNTTARPGKKSLPAANALVTTGIFSYTRNPIYLGMAVMLLAWMIFLENWLSIAGVFIFIGFISSYQIRAEEEALGHTFGEAYARYKKRVRRWI